MNPINVTLIELISRLDQELTDADALARVSEAHLRSQTLTDLGDQLVEHYVSKAKQSGASWTEIGDALGVSKQAAQQRRASTAFDRFTDLSRHVIVLAQEAARARKHDLIGTEHLLLGLLGEPQGMAHEWLVASSGSGRDVREVIEEAMPPAGAKMLKGHIPFASESKAAIEQAQRSANDIGHGWVGPEHMLLGLVQVQGSLAARILHPLGFTPDELRKKVKSAGLTQPAAGNQ
jgi:ATP-dependent Clp protease ATP-binding subunit ClpA